MLVLSVLEARFRNTIAPSSNYVPQSKTSGNGLDNHHPTNTYGKVFVSPWVGFIV